MQSYWGSCLLEIIHHLYEGCWPGQWAPGLANQKSQGLACETNSIFDTVIFCIHFYLFYVISPQPSELSELSCGGTIFRGMQKQKQKIHCNTGNAWTFVPQECPPPPPRVKCLPFSVVFRHSRFYTYCKLMVKKKWGGKGKWGSPPPPLFRHTNALIRRVWPNILVLVVALWVTIIPPNFLANAFFRTKYTFSLLPAFAHFYPVYSCFATKKLWKKLLCVLSFNLLINPLTTAFTVDFFFKYRIIMIFTLYRDRDEEKYLATIYQ